MTTRVLMLRAINVGTRRISMPELRELLVASGVEDVRTYLQSGNVVVSSDAPPSELASWSREVISQRFGFDVPVIVRTPQELEAVTRRDPFAGVATEPKRYFVSFLDRPLSEAGFERLQGLVRGEEQVTADGCEIYVWLPDGVARSKLATAMAAPEREVTATARNWKTVTALLSMASGAE